MLIVHLCTLLEEIERPVEILHDQVSVIVLLGL